MRFRDARFAGSDYNPDLDQCRLTGQLEQIFNLMRDGRYRTLNEISDVTNVGQASVSAQLRNLRKPEFGNHMVLKRRRGEKTLGIWEYQLLVYRHKYEEKKVQNDLFEGAA